MLVVVLNDGSTYTDIEGCCVLEVPDTVPPERMDEYVSEHSINEAETWDISLLLKRHLLTHE